MSENADIFKQVFDDLKRKDNLLSSPLGVLDLFLRQNKLGNNVEEFFGKQLSESVLEPMIESLEPLHQGRDMPPDYKLLEQVENFLSILRKGNILDESNKKELFDLLDKLIQRFNAIVKTSSLKFAAENPCGELLVKAKMNQLFSRVIELSEQTFKSLRKEDLKACNALALLIKLYKIFNKYPDRFVKTFGSVSTYEKLIYNNDDLLQFCKQVKSLPAGTEKELIYHIRDNLFPEGFTLFLETFYELNNLLEDSVLRDDSQFSKIMKEKNINWLEKIDGYNAEKQQYDVTKLIQFMRSGRSESVFIDKFIGVVKDKCDFSAFFSKEYFDINKLKSNNMERSEVNAMIRTLYICFKYDKNRQDAINTINDIFERAPEGFLSVTQILALLDICNEFDINIVITKDMFERLFKCLEGRTGRIKMHDLLLICGFCENGAISGELARRLVSLVEPHSNDNGFKMSITPEADSYRYGNKRFTRPTRLDDSRSYYRTQFSNLTVSSFELLKSKFEDGFVFRGDMRAKENSYYDDLSTVFLLYCFESHVRVKHTRKTAIDFFKRYECSSELIWIKGADENRNLKQYFKDRFWYYPRFNFGKVYQEFDGFVKEISLSSEKFSVENLMFLVFSNFKFGENSYITEQEFRQRIPDEIDDPRYFLWLFRVYREQGIMTKDVFKSYINRYKINNLKKLDSCFDVLLDSLIDHDVELLNLILDNCEISLSEKDRKSYVFRKIEQEFLQLENDGLTSRFYEKMGLACINEQKVWDFLNRPDNNGDMTKTNINSNKDSGRTRESFSPAYIQNESCELEPLDVQDNLKNVNVSLYPLNKPDNNGNMIKTNKNTSISDVDNKKYVNTVNKKRSMLAENGIKALIGFGIAAFIIGVGMIFAFLVFPGINFLLVPGAINFGLGVVFFSTGALCFKQYMKNFGGYDIKNYSCYRCFCIFRSKSIFRENTTVYDKPVLSQERNGAYQSKNKYEK